MQANGFNPRQADVRQGCVAIPRYGLGDILYTCLSLRFLQERRVISEAFVFVPPAAVALVELCGVRCVPCYSKALHLARPMGMGLLNEWHFWTQLLKWRGGRGFSVINDLFDCVLYKIVGIERFPEWTMGNYCRNHPVDAGLRGKINSWTGYGKGNPDGPRHILARCLNNLNQITECRLEDFWRCDFLTPGKASDASPKYVVVLPDAAIPERQLTPRQVERIKATIGDAFKYRIFSNHKSFREGAAMEESERYPSLTDLCRVLASCSMVVCSDSFGAHIAGLFGKPIFIVYPPSLRVKYWEWWGIPRRNAYHLFNGRAFGLTDRFVSVDYEDRRQAPLAFDLAGAMQAGD